MRVTCDQCKKRWDVPTAAALSAAGRINVGRRRGTPPVGLSATCPACGAARVIAPDELLAESARIQGRISRRQLDPDTAREIGAKADRTWLTPAKAREMQALSVDSKLECKGKGKRRRVEDAK